MATRYWVGGSGSWSDTAKWSTTSGGAGGASVPVSGDATVFDTNSGYTSSVRALVVNFSSAITCTSISVSTTSQTKRIVFTTNDLTTQRTLTVGSVTLAYVDFCGVIGAGAASWTGTSIGNLLGNSGITFTASVSRYARSADGSNTIGYQYIQWSATSGGSTGASIPLPQDNVFFDANSLYVANILYYPSRLICNNISFVGFSSTANSGSNPITVLGTLAYPSTSGAPLSMSGCDITLNGVVAQAVTGIGALSVGDVAIGGSSDIFKDSANITTVNWSGAQNNYLLTIIRGVFNAGVNNISADSVTISGTELKTINMGSSTWTLSGTNQLWDASITTGLTLNKNTANIVLNSTDTSVSFSGGGISYPKITVAGTTAGQTITFDGNNTIAELASTKTIAHTLKFTAGTTTTFDAFTVSGSVGNIVTVTSTSTTKATLKKLTPWYIGANSTVSNSFNVTPSAGDGVDYLAFSYINAIPAPSSFLVMF